MLEQAKGTPGLDFIKTHSDEEILTVRTYLIMKHLHTNLFPSSLFLSNYSMQKIVLI